MGYLFIGAPKVVQILTFSASTQSKLLGGFAASQQLCTLVHEISISCYIVVEMIVPRIRTVARIDKWHI